MGRGPFTDASARMVANRHPNVPKATIQRAAQNAALPVQKAMSTGSSLKSMAAESGYTGSQASERFMAGQIESHLAAGGHIGNRSFTPDSAPANPPPLKATPGLHDWKRGLGMANSMGMQPHQSARMALMYHGLRANATTPADGYKAAEGFYNSIQSASASQSGEELMNSASEALNKYGEQAGIAQDKLDNWNAWLKH